MYNESRIIMEEMGAKLEKVCDDARIHAMQKKYLILTGIRNETGK